MIGSVIICHHLALSKHRYHDCKTCYIRRCYHGSQSPCLSWNFAPGTIESCLLYWIFCRSWGDHGCFLLLLHDFVSVLICASYKLLLPSINIVCLNKPASACEMSSIILFCFCFFFFNFYSLPLLLVPSLSTPLLSPIPPHCLALHPTTFFPHPSPFFTTTCLNPFCSLRQVAWAQRKWVSAHSRDQ